MSLPEGKVIYQGYPVSMADGNGDGIGDFIGIEETTLPYLASELGVDGLWLSPFYKSPWKDGGYDVSNHMAVNPMHGALSDAESMIRRAGQLGIDVIADLVPCASSDQHPEFQRALQDPANTSYIFAPPFGDGPPNNWRSVFPKEVRDSATGAITRLPESAWRRVRDYWPHAAPERLDQWVFTNFAAHQPNWNHANPTVRAYLKDVAGFWLRRGISGFRVDSVDYLDHDRLLRDEPLNPYYRQECLPCDELDRRHSMRGPDNFTYLRELVSVVDEFPGSYMMLESYPNRFVPDTNPADHYASYYQALDGSLHGKVAPFCFEITDLPWNAQIFKEAVDTFQSKLRLGDVPVYPGGNHDKHRIASRYGERAARAAAVMQLALPGVAVIFQGDELGMTNHEGIPQDKRTDPYVDRDVSRTPVPMHANDPRAGFSTTSPDNFRLPIHPDFARFNVRAQQQDPNSTWNVYHRSIHERKQSQTLQTGGYEPVQSGNQHIFGFVRSGQGRGEHYLAVTNFAEIPQQVDLGHIAGNGTLVLSSRGVTPGTSVPLSALEIGVEETLLIRMQ